MEYVNVEYLAQYKTKVEDAGNEYTPAVNAVKNFLTCADGLKGSQDLEILIENMNTTKQKLQQVADAIKYMADRVVKLHDGNIRENYRNEKRISATELDW